MVCVDTGPHAPLCVGSWGNRSAATLRYLYCVVWPKNSATTVRGLHREKWEGHAAVMYRSPSAVGNKF